MRGGKGGEDAGEVGKGRDEEGGGERAKSTG